MSERPLVTAAELDALGPIRLLYVPSGRQQVQGLVTVPIDAWIARGKQSQTGLDDISFWHRELQDLGVGPDTVTVIADDGQMTEAARVWFILQYFGLPAAVLDGGLGAVSHLPAQAPPARSELHLKPGKGRVGLADRDRIKHNLTAIQVLDARTAAEFRGEDLKGNRRGGHLPGAVLVAHAELLDGTHLRAPNEIAHLLEEAGIDSERPLVSHCNGGGRAALAALAAVVAGKEPVEVYYLSFADWAADETCPVVTPG